MNAGLPGTGIGGLFYIASALWMPVNRALHGRGHAGRTWRRVFAQGVIAGGILWALAATGSLFDHLVAPAVAAIVPGDGAVVALQMQNLVRWVAIIGTVGLLAFVLLVVELARLGLRRRPGHVHARASTHLGKHGELPDPA